MTTARAHRLCGGRFGRLAALIPAFALALIFGVAADARSARASSIDTGTERRSVDIGADSRVRVPLTSWKALRDQRVVRQRYDYSCGAAALATLLHYGFGDDVDEEGVLRAIIARLSADDEASRKKEGLSLLDLKYEAEERGYRAQGFKLAAEYVPELKGPVLVFIQPRGYAHFAVLRGVRGGRAYLADPARGNVRMPLYRFFDMWLGEDGQGIIFVVEGEVAARQRR